MLNPDCLQGMDFVNKFIEDYCKIESIGFQKSEILKMLGSQDYVKDFVETPEFFVSAKRLPKGYKWSDGEKYQRKAGKHDFSETYTFLIVENDIYIKGFFTGWEFYNTVRNNEAPDGYETKWYKASKEIRSKICVIKNWKSMKPQYVLGKLDEVTPFFETSLTDFYAKNGGNLSMMNGPTLYEIVEIFKKKGLIADE